MIRIPESPKENEFYAKWAEERIDRQPFRFPYITRAVYIDDTLSAVWVYHDAFEPSIQISVAAISPRWCLPQTLKYLCGIPFNELKAKRMTAIIKKTNKRSRRITVGAGFKLEGIARKAHVDGTDLCIYGMLEQEYLEKYDG